jgi:hypothetical protein
MEDSGNMGVIFSTVVMLLDVEILLTFVSIPIVLGV